MPLDEKTLRRAGFDEANSHPVTMPGGATFYLPKPMIRIRPVFRDGKRVDEARLCTDDPEFDRLKEAVTAATSDEEADFGGAVTDLAAWMLLKNYGLTDEQLGEAFEVGVEGEIANQAWMTEVMAIAHGRGTRSFPDGSG
jgi:hypothetical protein